MQLAENSGIAYWESAVLADVPGVWHAFTSRLGGSSAGPYAGFNLSARVGDEAAAVAANRALLARAAGVDPALVRLQTQEHGARVIDLGATLPDESLVGDAFVTTVSGVPAIVGVADCVPILLAAEDGSVVAAVHAGWRGAVAGVVPAAVRALAERHGIASDRLRAAIGPSIGPCCFEVGPEVAGRFPADLVLPGADAAANPHVDLPGFVARQLVAEGVPARCIDRCDVCTMCAPELAFSHRASGGKTGRMVGIIVRAARAR